MFGGKKRSRALEYKGEKGGKMTGKGKKKSGGKGKWINFVV